MGGAGQTRERIYRFVRERVQRGAPPTVREVQAAFGFRAVQSAYAHLASLVAEGRLAKTPGKARGYRLPGARPTALVPLLGRVQAGALTAAVEDIEGYLPVQLRGRADDLFALRVRGDSMTGAGILDGDVVIVRRQRTAHAGEIVVALVGDEATVKTLRFRKGHAVLQPHHPAFAPIVLAPRDLTILGTVIEVRRTLA